MLDKVKKMVIEADASVLVALKEMDSLGKKLLLVFENQNFIGLISAGDIQRAIINDVDLTTPIRHILRSNYRYAYSSQSNDEIKTQMLQHRMEYMPIFDEARNLVDVLFWEDMFLVEPRNIQEKFNLPIIIMAGGEGSRLKPLTNVLPKPLIPIGEKTIIENIMDKFVVCGCHHFLLSVNYKSDMIRYYFENLQNTLYKIDYFQEKQPLGTGGSLHLLKDKITSTFFVSNCDILIDEDYAQILKYHRDNNNELTIVAAVKSYSIPYGVLETSDAGLLTEIKEKPELVFKINTGLYILEPHLIQEIPENQFYHITYLVEKLKKENRRVGVFPVSERSWTDIGEWSEYLKLVSSCK